MSVTVLGLGPMGRALAGALLRAGEQVTVWNRSPGKDRALVEQGANSARTPGEAAAASSLILVCVVNYDAADLILRTGDVESALQGRTVVNLTADTPSRAREVDDGTFSGADNPITSAASSMAHIVHAAEAHGIDSGVMRAAEGLARRVIGRGHGEDGFMRVAGLLTPAPTR
ncbi:NAD(P)-binding domain-containing protein [Paractinoplanes lichenicola]|uniref:NAD(P)-dependent oxidoreductase n=1 Tax=Paractinoplanes lichenicola TaxID=2802976 RepID=A0ABS1VZ62_9ACTN|nr:NAD(P)-binding domain-containing protein [Actinoplanes lichenicola]MBL7259769.1 NAD(P)-dependent oxidoreductase [Actinoplanes lichenicola]